MSADADDATGEVRGTPDEGQASRVEGTSAGEPTVGGDASRGSDTAELEAIRAELSQGVSGGSEVAVPGPSEAEAEPAASAEPEAIAAGSATVGPAEGEPAPPEPASEASVTAADDTALEVQEAAEQEAAASVMEAGVPEGADNDADAVEALLEAEATNPLLPAVRRDRVLSVPFLIYLGVWFVFSVTMVLVLRDAAVGGGLDAASQYALFVMGGLILTIFGPLLALFLWVVEMFRYPKGQRRGLLSTALLRGALATFGGVLLWWAAIVLLNYFKTETFF